MKAERVPLQIKAIRDTYDICTRSGTKSFVETLRTLGLGAIEVEHDKLVRQLGKICRYWEVCVNLTSFARTYPSLAGHLSLQTLASYEPELWKVGATKTSRYCVHAEIQLIFHYTINHMAQTFRARVIGASKSACYLCNLFIFHHGLFFVSKTHGYLYSKWTVPDLAITKYSKQLFFATVLSDMNRTVLKDINRNRIRGMKRLYAGDSWTSFHGRCPQPSLSDISTVISNNAILHRDADMTQGHPAFSVVQAEQSSAREGSNSTLKAEPARNEKEMEIAYKVDNSTPTNERDLQECDGVERISTPVALHSALTMVPAFGTSPTQSDTASPIAGIELSSKSPAVSSLISPSLSSSTTQELARAHQDLPAVNQSTTARSGVSDLVQPVPSRGTVGHNSPVFFERDEVAVDINCEEPVLAHVWTTLDEDSCENTTPISVELSSLKLDEDQVLRREDNSQELLLQFCNKGKPILGLGLRWIG